MLSNSNAYSVDIDLQWERKDLQKVPAIPPVRSSPEVVPVGLYCMN